VRGRIGNSRPDTRSGPTSPPPPPPPAGLTAIAQNDGGVRLSWDAVPNATAYILKRTDVTSGPYFGPFVTVARDIRGTTHVDAGGFHMDTTLCYVVSAMTDAGESADSPMAKVIPRKGTPTAPKSRPPAALNTRWKCTQSFIDYMKEVTNPAKVGEYGKSAKDGRYYPYSTPYGRLIGYGSPPQKTADYTEGITEAEATARLVAALNDVAATLGARIPDRHPEKKFEHLSADMQEVLVDYGYTEGVENIPAPLIEAVYAPDAWERMARDMVYVRVRKGLIQFPKNKAFFERWLAPKGY
jgi:hypothetical protein